MTNKEFCDKLKQIATAYKTLYVMGCFGAPMTAANKERYQSNHSYNKRPERRALIAAASADTFGFDCVCLIKAVLWGWSGKLSHSYGGASYGSCGVPDIDANAMIAACREVSSDFSKLSPGEALWLPDHIGIYIGDGLAVECSPAWKNGVQITAVNRDKPGYHRRDWKKHGKLPYITYEKEGKTMLETGDEIIRALKNGKHKVAINEVDRAVRAVDAAKCDPTFSSLYWILYKLVNG